MDPEQLCREVAVWACGILRDAKYAKVIVRNRITWEDMCELTSSELRDDLGFLALGDRKRILNAAQNLRLEGGRPLNYVLPDATDASLTQEIKQLVLELQEQMDDMGDNIDTRFRAQGHAIRTIISGQTPQSHPSAGTGGRIPSQSLSPSASTTSTEVYDSPALRRAEAARQAAEREREQAAAEAQHYKALLEESDESRQAAQLVERLRELTVVAPSPEDGSVLKNWEFHVPPYGPPQGSIVLDLSNQHFGPDGAKALASALLHPDLTELTHLDLQKNGIGDEGAMALVPTLPYLTSLQELNLCGNNIGEAGERAIEEALGPGVKAHFRYLIY